MYNIICIFMNINENNRNERKTAEKIRDVHTKLHKKSPIQPNMVSN